MTRVEPLHLFDDGPLPDEVLLQPTVGENPTCITDEIISDQDSHRRAAAGLLVAESTVWRWLATSDDTSGDDSPAERAARAGYVLSDADRDDYLDWRGNIAALRRARIAAGGRDVPPLRTLQRAFARQLTAAERAAAVDGVEGRR